MWRLCKPTGKQGLTAYPQIIGTGRRPGPIDVGETHMVMRSEDFTEQAREIIGRSHEAVRRHRHSQWDVEHVLSAILEDDEGVTAEVFRQIGVPQGVMREKLEALLAQAPKVAYESSQIFVTPRVKSLLERARDEAQRLNDEYISAEHLLVAVVQEEQGDTAKVLTEFGVDLEKVYQALAGIRGTHRVTDSRAESRYQSLERYSVDLTQLARDGKLDPGGRQGRRDRACDADPDQAHKEQPGAHWRRGRGQDRHRRGPRAAHSLRRRARRASGTQPSRPGHCGDGCREQVPRGVRGAP